MARYKQPLINPDKFEFEYPKDWWETCNARAEELYKRFEQGETAQFYELHYLSDDTPAPYRLIFAKYGPVWQNIYEPGRFIAFDNEQKQMDAGFYTAVVERHASVVVISNDRGQAGFKIIRRKG